MYIASVITTKGIDMDNGRIGFLKEHEPGKELTITEEGNISFTYVLVQCKKKPTLVSFGTPGISFCLFSFCITHS